MKKVIILGSLLFIANAIAVDTPSKEILRLEKELDKAISARRKHTEAKDNEEKDLLETEEGQVYAKASSNWGDCARFCERNFI